MPTARPLLVFFSLVLFAGAGASASAYRNPIAVPNDWPAAGQADPRVHKFLGVYYLYTTKEAGSDVKLRAWRSRDLVHWELASNDLTPGLGWEHAWAPEVFHHLDGTFYMYHSGPEGDPPVARHRLLEAGQPWGPFTLVDGDFAPTNTIDGTVFRDDDGQLYYLYADGNDPQKRGIHYRTMSSPLAADGAPQYLSDCIVDALPAGHEFYRWTEGPQLVKIDGQYYLSYCGNLWHDPSYQSHVARGTSIDALAPQANNPVLASLSGDYTGAGHNYVFRGPDLVDWYTVYHALDGTGAELPTYRQLFLDRVDFADNGDLRVDGGSGPSFTERPDPALPDFQDYFERGTVNPAGLSRWSAYGAGLWGTWQDPAWWGLLWGDNRGHGTDWAIQHAALPDAEDYVLECNLKLRGLGSGSAYPKFGLVTSFDPVADSGLAVLLDPPNGLLALRAWVEGSAIGPNDGWRAYPLPGAVDYEAWHCLRVEKSGGRFEVSIDGMKWASIELDTPPAGARFGPVLEDAWAEFGHIAASSRSLLPPEPPEAPDNPQALELGSSSIRWGWRDNSSDEDAFLCYLDAGAGSPATLAYRAAADHESWTATALEPDTVYSFQVSAESDLAGESSRSPLLSARTLAATPLAPLVADLRLHGLRLGIDPAEANPASTEYAVGVTPAGGTTGWVQDSGRLGATPRYRPRADWQGLRIEGLTAGADYDLHLLARNGAGVLSSPGPAVRVSTPSASPAAARAWPLFD